MNLTISGHHLEITPAIRSHVESKLDRMKRNFDGVIDISVLLAVDNVSDKEKSQRAEIRLNLSGKTLHAESVAQDLYAAIDILMDKLRKAAKQYQIKEVAVAGGVSANNGLRNAFREHAAKYGWDIFIPKFSYTTDNAAMIAITGYFKYLDKDFCPMDAPAYSRVTL